MPGKMKTHKMISDRVRVTKTGKILKRTGGQDHFNSHESGKVTRNKRNDKPVSKSYERTVKNLARVNK
ncbi:50S ribosomal protein L35 [Candidatus Uhrbacteria bacterium]|nr:50S ribosomal protein L35 [Candidatus Uhrbacteria bacterium]